MARSSSLDQSLHPSRAVSIPRSSVQDYPGPNEVPSPQISGNFLQGGANEDVSPLASSTVDRGTSEDGGYFPKVSNEYADRNSVLPGAPTTEPSTSDEYHASESLPMLPQPPNDTGTHQPSLSHTFPNHPGQESDYARPYSSHHNVSMPQIPTDPAEPKPPPNFVSHTPHQHPQATPPLQAPQRQPAFQYTSQHVIQKPYSTDEESIIKAQKHARWAISALNFEDVTTAVKELKGALESLGAG